MNESPEGVSSRVKEVCVVGSGVPNIAFVVSVPKSIYSPLRIFYKMRGVTGGSDGLWVATSVGNAVSWIVAAGHGGLITC